MVTTFALASAALALGVCVAAPGPETGRAQDTVETAPPPACNEQEPQDFLIRGNFNLRGRMDREERLARVAIHERAVRYRTEQYGYFPGFGRPEWNAHPPSHYAVRTKVFGRHVRLHQRILPAVRCAEAEIERACAHVPYTPRALSGIRDRNTYHNNEVSNHVYGIALDIDPHLNTCCGCVAKWQAHPLCKRQVSSIFERMAMPECWVHAFEKYGFYWLGHDTLQDTMHFEFLGDPDRILATPP